jgi:valyl-tRNA synthetase
MDLLIKLVSTLRSIRVEKNIPSKSRPIIFLKNIDLEKRKIIDENKNLIINLAKLNEIKFSSVNEEFENDKFIITTIDEITLMISLDGLIDTESERSRLNKELTNINNEIEIISKRLNNPMFVEKAPSKVVLEVKNKKKVFNQRKVEIEKALKNL